MRPALLPLLTVVALTGCGSTPTGPELSPDQFPKALERLETLTDDIVQAFETGNPKAADRPLHQLNKAFSSIKRLAEPAGLDEQQRADLNAATDDLLDAFGELHEPMHQTEFPEDFDFEPIRAKIEAGIEKVRAAVPAEIAAELKVEAEKRAAARAVVAEETEAADDAEAATEEPAAETPADATPSDDAGASRSSPGAAFTLVSTAAAAPPRAPLGPSVLLFDAESLERAPDQVAHAAELVSGAPPGDRWVQLVPTLHARLNPDLTVDAYGLMTRRRGSWTAPENFTEATDRQGHRFRDAFAAAIGQAVRRGLHLAVLPHLDAAGGPVDGWRNHFRFAPDAAVGAGSYESLLIEPLADALAAEATSDTRVDLALSGEMGRSLFEHPAAYQQLAQRLRDRFADIPGAAGVRVGVALNWDNLAGDLDPALIDRTAVGELFAGCDFVGVSCYAPVGVPPKADDFSRAIDDFLARLRALGGELAPGTRLVLSEVGIGGGVVEVGSDGLVYESPREVAAKPYEGRGDAPRSPWQDAGLAQLRRQYHAALLAYLTNEAAAPPVDKAFLWSEGPWDPQGVADRRFRDEAIAAAIDRHNAVD